MIDWASFSWEALATLVTGLAAVVAAGLIGYRQSQIQDRQLSLQEQELKIGLLEERLAVYDDVHAFFAVALTHGRPAEGDYERNFRFAMIKARFLFSDDLNQFLRQVWEKHCDFGLHHTMSKRDASDDRDERVKHIRSKAEVMKWFSNSFGELHEHFAEIRPVLEERSA